MLPRRLQRLPSRQLAGGATVLEATTLRARLLGLAFLRPQALPRGHALLIPHCRSVHTFGMRFALDVVFLDEHGRALQIAEALPPRRVRTARRAFAVFETHAGDAALFVSPPRPPAAPDAASTPSAQAPP